MDALEIGGWIVYGMGIAFYAANIGRSQGRRGAQADVMAAIAMCLTWPIWISYDTGYRIGHRERGVGR